MQKTQNYNLNQWEPTDKLSRADFNSDNAAIDAALAAVNTTLANKAEKSAVSAVETALANYKTGNDAAVAAVTQKANTAYTTDAPPTECVIVDTTGKAAGDTICTFAIAPKFAILRGTYGDTVIQAGSTASLMDILISDSRYEVGFQLSGAALIMTSRERSDAAATLTVIAFY